MKLTVLLNHWYYPKQDRWVGNIVGITTGHLSYDKACQALGHERAVDRAYSVQHVFGVSGYGRKGK